MTSNSHELLTRRKLLAWAAVSLPAAKLLSQVSFAEGAEQNAVTGDAVLLNYPGWIGKSEEKGFSARFPGAKITVSTEVPDSGSYAQFVKSRPGAFDFFLGDVASVAQAKAAGVFQQMDFSKVPNIKNIAPKYRRDYPDAMPNDTGKVVIGYRKDLVKATIHSWADFWKLAPKLDGRVTMLDIDGDTIGVGLKYLGYSVNSTNAEEYAKATAALIKIKPNLQAVTSKDLAKKLAGGQIAMCTCFDYDIAAAQGKSKNIAWVIPDEGTTGYLEGFIPVKGTKKLDLVHQFMNFHLEPKNYADFINATGSSWLMPAAEKYIKPSIRSSEVLAPTARARKLVEYGGFRGAKGTQALAKAWAEFKAA